MLCILLDPQSQNIIPIQKLIWDHFGVDAKNLGSILGSGSLFSALWASVWSKRKRGGGGETATEVWHYIPTKIQLTPFDA